MSHFVSTGANFDDLNAQLLQRRTQEEGDDIEEEGEEQGDNSGSQTGQESHESEGNDGTIKGRPNPYTSQHGRNRHSRSSLHRPKPDHHPSSASMSRKNSQEDFLSTPSSSRLTSRRERKLSDPDVQQARQSSHHVYDSPQPSRPSSPPQQASHNLRDHKEVAFSDNVVEAKSASTSISEAVQRSNSGIVYPRHRSHNENGGHRHPHHVHDAEHQGRLKESAEEVLPPRKLGTWDGVFMPVTLNVSFIFAQVTQIQ
jgi:potassium/chloride transporter 9